MSIDWDTDTTGEGVHITKPTIDEDTVVSYPPPPSSNKTPDIEEEKDLIKEKEEEEEEEKEDKEILVTPKEKEEELPTASLVDIDINGMSEETQVARPHSPSHLQMVEEGPSPIKTEPDTSTSCMPSITTSPPPAVTPINQKSHPKQPKIANRLIGKHRPETTTPPTKPTPPNYSPPSPSSSSTAASSSSSSFPSSLVGSLPVKTKTERVMKWEWSLDLSKYEPRSSERIFFERRIQACNQIADLLLIGDPAPKTNCVEMSLQIYDRLLVLFEAVCDITDTDAQGTYIDLTGNIPNRLLTLAKQAANRDLPAYNRMVNREVRYVERTYKDDPYSRQVYLGYMDFLQVIGNDNDVEYLRNAVMSSDSQHNAYILPMTTVCNAAKRSGRVFATSILALLCVKICKIVDISSPNKLNAQNTVDVLQCCWDLFDSISQGDLAAREAAILTEVRQIPQPTAPPAKKAPKEPRIKKPEESKMFVPPPQQETSSCSLQ